MKKYNIKEQLEKDVKAICFNRGRIAGSKGSEKSREYLLGRMREIELVPYSSQKEIYIPYNPGDGNRFHNLVGVLKGKNPELSPVLIGAHYDSLLEAECADDNAAAVAIALSAAEALQSKNLDRDVVVALFDAEEPPYFLGASMGSTRFFEDATDKRGFNAAVIMDLVGHDVPMTAPLPGNIPETIKRLLFITGAESAP